MARAWERILPGCGVNSTLARGVILAARWLYEPQPINDQRMEVRFPRRAGRYRSGGLYFRPRIVRVVYVCSISDPGMKIYPPRVRQEFDIGPRGNSRRALAP